MEDLARYSLPAFFNVYRYVTQLLLHAVPVVAYHVPVDHGARPSADATVKPFAARPVLLSYTNAAPTVIKTPRIIPNKICIAGVSHRSDGLNSQTLIGFR
jgi:hypothetical protein